MNLRQFLFFLLLSSGTLFGQKKEYIFKNFTQEEGLPSNEAYYVFEDSRHFLWFATDLGVVRYNGSRFEQFNLPDNVVFKIREDNKGRIWFFSHKAQLAYFENEKVHLYKYNDEIAKRITKINIVEGYVDEDDNITLSSSTDSSYLITKSGVIHSKNEMLFNNNITEFKIETINGSSLYIQKIQTGIVSDTFLFQINKNHKVSINIHSGSISHYGGYIDKFGDIIFFAGNLLFKLFKNGVYKTKYFPNKILCLEKNDTSLWVGMLKKGAVLIGNDLTDISDDTMLLNKSVTSIKKDHEGGIWISTLESGVFYEKNPNISIYQIDDKSDKNISRLLQLNNIFLYSNSKGIYEFHHNNSNLFLPLINDNISDIVCKDSILYILGSFQQRFGYETYKYIKPGFIKSYVKIVGSSEGLVINDDVYTHSTPNNTIQFKTKQIKKPGAFLNIDSAYLFPKLLLNNSAKIFSDSYNNLWGGSNSGLYKGTKNADILLKISPGNPLLEKGVTCIRQMNNGLLTIGIRFGGVVLLDDTTIIANITEKNGLLSDKIRYLLPIQNDLWVATAKGISVVKFASFNPIKYSIINIGKNDGFYNLTINQLILFQNNLVAATSNGLYFIKNPEELINRKPIPIPFFISNINSYKGDTSSIQSLIVPYSKNRILLKYTAACFNSAEEVKYQYTFSSEDTGWTTTTSTELLLENLEPGDYNLRIKAVIPNQNRASEIQYLNITVEKPWWQNNWFRAGVILLFMASGFAFTRHRIKKIKTEEELKTKLNAKIAELEQTALRAQMNPHFIFNCLTSIQQLIVTGNKMEANEYLVKFSRLIRKTLDLSANPFISIRDEMDYLDEYLFLEQLRIADHFEYTINAAENINTDKILIPNMMIQPVVENCIRHGIKSLENKRGIVNINFAIKNDKLFCIVKDNGIGRKSSLTSKDKSFTKHKSYGIEIIEKRLKVFTELSDEDMSIEIKDLYTNDGSAAGTEVTLQLPFKTIV